MSISLKVSSAMVFMAIVLGLSVIGLQHYLVNTKFQYLEHEFAKLNIDRIANRFSVELNKIDALVYDWSAWDDTYTFAQDLNTNYVESNLYPDTFQNYGTNIVLFLNNQGEVLWAGIYEFQPDLEVIDHTDLLLDSFLPEAMTLAERIDLDLSVEDQFHRGLFYFDNLAVLFSIRPIYKSSSEGESQGYIFFGTSLSESVLAQLQDDVALTFEISNVINQRALSVLPEYDIIDSETANAQIRKPFLPDKSDGFLITTDIDKQITQTGLASTQSVVMTFVALSLLIIFTTWWWLQRTTILPIKRLKNSIVATTSNKDYSQRLSFGSSDEVYALAESFNDLLQAVEIKTENLNHMNQKLQSEHQKLLIFQTELKRANAELTILSEKDALTGLHNRMAMERKLTQEWNVLHRKHEPLSVLMIDIDQFKEYNDLYGHQTGDDCLRRVAIVLSSNANRASDMVARYGGEEFLLILPRTAQEEAHYIAQKLSRSIVTESIEHAHSEHGHLTVSVGVACIIPNEALTIQDLIRSADKALYRAKNQGRNQVCM